MKKRKFFAKILSVVMMVSLFAGIPQNAKAAWTPQTKHDIPAYQFKNIYATEKVAVTLDVDEVINATTHPIQTKPIEKSVKFQIFNSTLQKIEKEVYTKNGKLENLELIKDHNYIFFLMDSEYRMPNGYIWVKGKNNLVNMKDIEITSDSKVIYHYGPVDGFFLYKRDEALKNPQDARRVTSQLPVVTEAGGALAGVDVKFTSDVETITKKSNSSGKIVVELLEDVNYMVTVDHPNWAVQSFPIVVKDKSEYGAGKYTYDYSSCGQVEEIVLVPKADEHKKDTVISNKNYDTTFPGIYEGISGHTTVKGMNFKDFMILEKKLDPSVVSGLEGKDYDVLQLSLINPHRWEIARLITGNFEITEEITGNKRVANVYYKDGKGLQKLDFKQSGNQVTFAMNTLSVYPIVIEYGEVVPMIDRVDVEPVEVTENGTKAKVTVTGSSLPERLWSQVFYKKIGALEPEKPAVNQKVLKVKVVDESGKPVSGIDLYLDAKTNGSYADLQLKKTDAEGRLEYTFTDRDMLLPGDEESYELLPKKGSNYTCEAGKAPVLEFEVDADFVPSISLVDGKAYTGEIVLVLKNNEAPKPQPQPDPQPEKPAVDQKVLKVKVVDESGKPVSGIDLYLDAKNNGSYADLQLKKTDAEGRLEYTFTDRDMLLPGDEESYELLPKKGSNYACETGKAPVLEFELDTDWIPNISLVDGKAYTGEIVLVLKNNEAPKPQPQPEKPQPEEPKPEKPAVDKKVLNAKVVDEEGNPVKGMELYLDSLTYGDYANVALGKTDEKGMLRYTFNGSESIFGAEEDSYKLLAKKNANYTCDTKNASVVEFEIDADFVANISLVDGKAYTGEITVPVTAIAKAQPMMLAVKAGEPLSDWIAVGNPAEVATVGNETERTFEVLLPTKEYPEAVKWTVGVAFDAEYFATKMDVKGNEVDLATYEAERQKALEALKQAIADAEEYQKTLDKAEYTEDSWKNFQDVIDEAKKLASTDSSKAKYDEMIQKLNDAKNGLTKISVPEPNPQPGPDPGPTPNPEPNPQPGPTPNPQPGPTPNPQPGPGFDKPGENLGSGSGIGQNSGNGTVTKPSGNVSGTGNNQNTVPKTGDTAPVTLAILGLVVAFGAIVIVLFMKRKKK